ncbi:septum formation family protein [Saccharopolyspora sp. CA-218241]|uniref:septum formation family protein n=1 Tax=Saccharopolyspora sp. CA-218241 TaxID=3240027 RepID=UPI003D95817F
MHRRRRPGPRSPRAAAEHGTPAEPGAGPHRRGDCLSIVDGRIQQVGCETEHQYEVVLSRRMPPEVGDAYPPPLDTAVSPVCRGALPEYVGSPDAPASRLEALSTWSDQQEWDRGDRWFACLVVERGPDNEPLPRTGSLAGALTGGLGSFRRCYVDEPLADGPTRVVPCSRPHRSEAVPGVLDLGSPDEPAPGIDAMLDRTMPHCDRVVADYLGGPRPGSSPTA